MASNHNTKRGGTTSDGVGGGPQHGRRVSGGGALRSLSSNFPEPEVLQQALGENHATAENTQYHNLENICSNGAIPKANGGATAQASSQEALATLQSESSLVRDSNRTSKGLVLLPRSEINWTNTTDLAAAVLEAAKLQSLPAIRAEYYTRKSKYTREDLHFVKLTFSTQILIFPFTMNVAGKLVKVRELLPKPRQCQKCWKFGHPSKYCRSDLCCPICGMTNHNFNSCRNKGNGDYEGHCPNCDVNGHTAFAKKCPLYLREEKLLAIMDRLGISKKKALSTLEESDVLTGVTYAKRGNPQQQQTSGLQQHASSRQQQASGRQQQQASGRQQQQATGWQRQQQQEEEEESDQEDQASGQQQQQWRPSSKKKKKKKKKRR